ncbi:MAG: hypothetical protein IM323_18035 [Microcystis sp. M049S1]|nr:hypothetical protein [Microcystis sp. M049S1]
MSVVALIEFYFKLIICITIPEEPDIFPGLSGSFPGYPTALYSFTNKCQNKDVDVGYSNGKFCDDK